MAVKVGCRWPGGMTIALQRPSGSLTVHLEGPPGEPSLLPKTAEVPSRYAATALHKRVVDTVKRMEMTAGDTLNAEIDYRVTEVSGAFWSEWYAKNAELDVIRHRMVFEVI